MDTEIMTPIRRLTLLGAGFGLFFLGKRLLQRSMTLREKVVVITGGSKGLGFALAQACAHQGARLVICGRTLKPLQVAEAKLKAMGAEVLIVSCDVGDQQQAINLIDLALERYGQIDVLINNAGIITVGPQKLMKAEDYERSMQTIFWGTVYTSLAVLPFMQERHSGHIVNITSIGGKVSIPHLLTYSTAKAAALAFSQGLHAEVEGDSMHVLTVVPGLMRTGSHLQIETKGNHKLEYSLFGMLATSPLSSTSARHAAKTILKALKKGKTEIIITPQAQIMARVFSLLPAIFTNLLTAINRLLPTADRQGFQERKGYQEYSGLPRLLTVMGEPAAHAYNQLVGVNTHKE